MSLSNYAEQALVKHLIGEETFTPPTNTYIALSKADPLDDASGIDEPVGGGYARILFNDWTTAASRSLENNTEITFAEMTANNGTVTHFAIFDALTAGNMLYHGALTTSKALDAGINPKFNAGELSMYAASGAISTFLANELLDHMFGNGVYSTPTLYLAGTTVSVTDTMTGSTITEPSGNGYARKTAPSWAAASGGASSNSAAITFDTATGSWGTLLDAVLLDAASAGNVLMYGTLAASRLINTGDTFQFSIGELDISMA